MNSKSRNRRSRLCVLAIATAAAAGFTLHTHAQSTNSSKALTSPPTEGWPTNGGSLFNQRHSPLNQINRQNVGELKAEWRARLDGSGTGTKYSGEAQPIAADGVLYIVSGADDVFAIDIETGERLWKYQANLDQTIDTVCCGWSSRGVGIGDGRIYVGQLDGQLVALDQDSGDVIWSVQAEDWQDGFSITSAPLYYDDLVITGFSGAEYGIRGRVKAFNADDGSLAWTFYTVPGPGEFGHETWPADNDVWMDGGGSVWQTPAVDPELGLIYFSTGNPGPDYNGAVRAGDNLFTASIVALDVHTGEYRWHFQQVHHDLWDYDAPSPVVLFDLEYEGVLRKGIVGVSKTGWAYILDRTNGEPLVDIIERPVPQDARQATSATQPYPIGDAIVPQSIAIAPEGYRLRNQGRIFTPFWTDEIVIAKPSISGGVNWPPSSYDPDAGYLYVCAEDSIGTFNAQEISDDRPPPGELYAAGIFGGTSLPAHGVFAAMDMRTNQIVWRQHWAEECYSGSVSTAGGLVFVGRNDGRLTALDSASGKMLWGFQTGAGMNAPASVFAHNGKQYVAAYSAGNLFAGTTKGDSLWLFSLDGTLEQVEPNSAMTDAVSGAADGVADLDAGQQVYETACTFCHGEEALGGHGGGPTLANAPSAARISEVAAAGQGDMPAFAGALTPEQLRDVGAFIYDRLLPQQEPQ